MRRAPQRRRSSAPGRGPFILPPVMPDDRYLEVAAGIGLNSGPAMQARMGRFFVDHGWPIYYFDHVMAYLNSLCEPAISPRYSDYYTQIPQWGATSTPVWVPLRTADQRRRSQSMVDRVYAQACPLHAIEKVWAMEQHFGPDALAFAVSEIERVPDPFLAVQAVGTPMYVIDVWDEPGWGC